MLVIRIFAIERLIVNIISGNGALSMCELL
jgi:hypothetical protein